MFYYIIIALSAGVKTLTTFQHLRAPGELISNTESLGTAITACS